MRPGAGPTHTSLGCTGCGDERAQGLLFVGIGVAIVAIWIALRLAGGGPHGDGGGPSASVSRSQARSAPRYLGRG